MKKIFIIDCYADNSEKINILTKCIDSIKSLNVDILLVSHYPVPNEVMSKVNYFIYDSDNKFNQINYFFQHWCATENHLMEFFVSPELGIQSHEFAIIKSIRNALYFTNSLDYEYFLFTEYDNIFSENDKIKLETMYSEMEKHNYDYIVFDSMVHGQEAIESLIFSGKIKQIISLIDSYFPKTIEEYNAKFTWKWPYALEIFLRDMLNTNNKHNGLIIKESIYKFFDNQKNMSRIGSISAGVTYDYKNDKYYLYIKNEDDISYKTIIYNDENAINSFIMPGKYSITVMQLKESSKFEIKFYTMDELEYKKMKIEYDEKNKEFYKKIARITFNN